MKKGWITIVVLFIVTVGYGQELNLKGEQGGLFSMGLRTTMSVFGHDETGVNAIGYGGQFRLQLANRLNTEWFGDFTRGNIGGIGNRTDYHIGWSVMYYFTDKVSPPVKPYILAGHCFDRTEITSNLDRDFRMVKNSSAIQAGAGVHFNLTQRLDITFTAQYMFHLGKDLHAHVENGELHMEFVKGTGLEGHVLLNLGINYKIADLWTGGKNKRK